MNTSKVKIILLIVIASLGFVTQSQSDFEMIALENVANLAEIKTWNRIEGADGFLSATFNPDGLELAVSLNNGQVEFISTQTLETLRVVDNVITDNGWLWLDYSVDGNELLFSNMMGVYTLIDVQRGEILASNTTPISENIYFAPTPDIRKYKLSNSLEESISIHDTITGQELLSVEDAECGQISYDGKLLLTCHDDSSIQIWDIESGEIIYEFMSPTHDVRLQGRGFTPDGLVWISYQIFSDSDNPEIWENPIQFWDIASGEQVLQLEGEGVSYYTSLNFDPTNTYALVWGLSRSFSDSCWMWDLSNNETLYCPAGGNMWTTFSSDGQLLAISNGTNYNVYIHETANAGRAVAILETDPTYYVEFSPDGRFMITIDTEIHLWGISSN